jgi:hypothetical protein
MTPIEVLVAARDRLLEKGWTAGIGRCVYMTIEAVMPCEGLRLAPPQIAALHALRLVTGEQSLTLWNARQPSVVPVLVAIDAAIELLRLDL